MVDADAVVVRALRVARDENTSACETIRSICLVRRGVVFTFRGSLGLDVLWCVDEVVMLCRQAKLQVKRRDVEFGVGAYQLLVPFRS
jgi:hypothetical protein